MHIPYFMSYNHYPSLKDIISSKERHQTMKWFDAGTKKNDCFNIQYIH